MKTTTENNVETRETELKDGYKIAAVFHPQSVPWDVEKTKQGAEWSTLMHVNDIPFQIIRVEQKNLTPRGSGSGGRVRFGDSMMPGKIKLAVPVEVLGKAEAVLSMYRKQITEWVSHDSPPSTLIPLAADCILDHMNHEAFDASTGKYTHPCGCITSWFWWDASNRQWTISEWGCDATNEERRRVMTYIEQFPHASQTDLK